MIDFGELRITLLFARIPFTVPVICRPLNYPAYVAEFVRTLVMAYSNTPLMAASLIRAMPSIVKNTWYMS